MDYKVITSKKELEECKDESNIIFLDIANSKMFIKGRKIIKYYRLMETKEDYKIKIKSSTLNKCIENATLEELYSMMPDIPKYKIDLVYNYLHKKPYVSYSDYAYNNYIAEVTLYRYLKLVKETYLQRI